MNGEEITQVADELYALAPAEFTAARAKALSAAKGTDLAPAIKALRKPSTSAWLINTLARRQPDDLDQLIEVGSALREAQLNGDGERLRSLSGRRRELVGELSASAGQGHQVSDAVGRELYSTLDAAVLDPAAAGAIRSGRLIRALTATGLDPVELAGAVALPDQLPAIKRVQLRSVPAAQRSSDPRPESPELQEALARAALAERAVVRTEAALNSSAAKLEQAQAQVDDAAKALDAAAKALELSKQALAGAKAEHQAALRTRDSARREVRRAESR